MLKFIQKILGTKSDRDLKELRPELDKILAVESGIQALSNNELRGKTEEFKQRIADVQAEETAAVADLKKQIDEEKDVEKTHVTPPNLPRAIMQLESHDAANPPWTTLHLLLLRRNSSTAGLADIRKADLTV